MATSVALIEFIVIGAIWTTIALSFLPLLSALGVVSLFLFKPLNTGVSSFSWVLLPLFYVIGIITQSLTWRWWYMPRVHRPDLDREIVSRPQYYNGVFNAMKLKGYNFLGLPPDHSALENGRDLGIFLDALRWELFASPRQELSRQYLFQFHLYRISYGVLPPIFFALILYPVVGGCLIIGGGAINLIVFLLFGTIVLLALYVGARTSASHRRRRNWKYLVCSINAILNEQYRDQGE